MIVSNGNIVVNNGRWIIPERMKYKVNLIQTTGGTISAVPVTGVNGTTVTLSNTPLNIEYTLNSYSITGSTLYDGNKFKFNNSDVDVTATWNYTPVPVPWNYVEIGGQLWSEDISINDGGTGIVTRNNKTYYNYEAANRLSNYINANYIGWRVATWDDWQGLFVCSNINQLNGAKWYDTLRSVSGWEYYNGTDNFGFNMTNNGYYWYVYDSGSWFNNGTMYWVLRELDGTSNYIIGVGYSSTTSHYDIVRLSTANKESKLNIRLVKDLYE